MVPETPPLQVTEAENPLLMAFVAPYEKCKTSHPFPVISDQFSAGPDASKCPLKIGDWLLITGTSLR